MNFAKGKMTNIAGNKSFFLLPTIHHEAHGDWHLVRRTHERACPHVRHSKMGGV